MVHKSCRKKQPDEAARKRQKRAERMSEEGFEAQPWQVFHR